MLCAGVHGQTVTPPSSPSAASAAPAPSAPPAPAVARPVPAAPGQNPINAQAALWIKQAMDDLPQEPGMAGVIKGVIEKYPKMGVLLFIFGVLRVVGLPVHTLLDRYLQRKLSPAEYAEVHTAGSTVFKQFDWLVNLVTSVKPGTVSAAFNAFKQPEPMGEDEAMAEAIEQLHALGWSPPQPARPAAAAQGPALAAPANPDAANPPPTGA